MAEDTVSTGELVSRLSEQTSRLVRDEVALAKVEMTEKAKHAGIGTGLFSAQASSGCSGSGRSSRPPSWLLPWCSQHGWRPSSSPYSSSPPPASLPWWARSR